MSAVDALEAMENAHERTPLLLEDNNNGNGNGETNRTGGTSGRMSLYKFLEAKTVAGAIYERFMICLILVNVLAFILGSLFDTNYNLAHWAKRGVLCGDLCDAFWFGNYIDNGLACLHLGSTSILEILTVAVFTIEYCLRLYTADLESQKYSGFWGRLRFIPTFFSMVDLASTVPFYLDALIFRHTDWAASSFLRMFRLLRMMRVEGRYDTALSMVDDVWDAQKGILFTALFVGLTTWMSVSSLYYLAERRNFDMVYCPDCDHEFDAYNDCTMDDWGIVSCTGCNGCYNFYESIPMASYYSLLNLFGEFPHIVNHSTAGKIVAVFTVVVAVAVFALPAGIIGNGLEEVIDNRHQRVSAPIQDELVLTPGFRAAGNTPRAVVYNWLHSQTEAGARALDWFINSLIVATALSYMLDTLAGLPPSLHVLFDSFELISVSIFTMEYAFRVYSAVEDPKYTGPWGRFKYMTAFLSIVDLLSFLPYWIETLVNGRVISTTGTNNTWSNAVRSLRLLRILRFERYTHAFLTFDDVIRRYADVLTVTAFSAILLWVFFSACLYFSERNSKDSEISSNYKTIPDAMWITLLNLSGESPLSEYSVWGKIVTGIIGLFATGIVGIPIGVMGVGFEEIMAEENADNTSELEDQDEREAEADLGSPIERSAYNFVNGFGSVYAQRFEMIIYALILLSVAVGAWQTVDGEENAFVEVEWVAVVVFTIEYLMRLVGTGADPEFAHLGGPFVCRLRFSGSFYSVIDLLAIVPFYLALALPNSVVNEYDEYLRMIRILRLIKLDKFIPSISLIVTLWILFAAGLFLSEHKDYRSDINPVPLYGCDDGCTMSDRFQTFFDSMVYTGVHLTGDYPIITYSWPARFINFFMVIVAVGVVSIPSGLIASGFVDIVQSKNKKRRGQETMNGDDWYEISYHALEGVEPPRSPMGLDSWQIAVNEFLNGKATDDGHHVFSTGAFVGRIFMFTVIILNVAAVLLESVPTIDKAVGNEPGNIFDTFEFFSVTVFALEYMLRLFCAPKNRDALYSSWVYATTFFGIVDVLSTAPWFIEHALIWSGHLDGDNARLFRIFRIFRLLQLEDFVTAFSKLDNVFRASQDVLKATGLMAMIVWVGCGALFFIFEENNPNWRTCDDSVPQYTADGLGCYDFASTSACNAVYPGACSQSAFRNMPDSLYYTAVFLGGEWGVVDFTWPGRIVCLFLCVVGIGLYSIPIGTLFDSFGAVLGMSGEDDGEEDEGRENGNDDDKKGH